MTGSVFTEKALDGFKIVSDWKRLDDFYNNVKCKAQVTVCQMQNCE